MLMEEESYFLPYFYRLRSLKKPSILYMREGLDNVKLRVYSRLT